MAVTICITGAKPRVPLREDFSKYKDGDTTDWGPAGKVITGADGRKWLAPAQKGQKPIGINVELPDDGYIEFDYSAVKLESRPGQQHVLSGITLVDEAEAKFRIEWSVDIGFENSEYDWRYCTLKLPGGANVGYRNVNDRLVSGTIRISKAGNTITVQRDGESESLTANTTDFKKFTRFEVDTYKGQNSMISFTNFNIGKTTPDGSKSAKR